MRRVEVENGMKAWAFRSSQYIQAAIENVEIYTQKCGWRLPKTNTPLNTVYRPELDTSPEFNMIDSAYYQSLIEILRWMVEINRVGICLETSIISSYLALSR